jgi:hypothetical protein
MVGLKASGGDAQCIEARRRYRVFSGAFADETAYRLVPKPALITE